MQPVALPAGSPLTKTHIRTKEDLKNHLKSNYETHKNIGILKAYYVAVGRKAHDVDIRASVPALVAYFPNGFVRIDGALIKSLERRYKKNAISVTEKIAVDMNKRVRRPSRRRSGFSAPKVFNQEIINFFLGAGLPAMWEGQRIETALPFFQDGIGTQNMIRNLLTVYAYYTANPPLPNYAEENKKGAPIKRNFLGVDQYMNDSLVNVLNAVAAKGGQVKKNSKQYGTDAMGRPQYKESDFHKQFNRNNFKLSSFQSIGAAGILADPNQWTQEQRTALGYNPSTGEVGSMAVDEKNAYADVVIAQEYPIKEQFKAAKKVDKNAIPMDIPYDQYGQQLQAQVGHQLSPITLTQLSVDKQSLITTQYLAYLRAKAAGQIA
jgi:hypothetical protein